MGAVRRIGAVDHLDGFGQGVLAELSAIVPFDLGVFNEVDPERRFARFDVHPPDAGRPDWTFDTYDTHLPGNPMFRHVSATGDASATRLSDFVTREELHQSRLYVEVLAPLGVDYQVALSLTAKGPAIAAIALLRSRVDFTDDEVALLDLLRPHLVRVHHRLHGAAARGRTPHFDTTAGDEAMRGLGLTERETTVLRLLVAGLSMEELTAQMRITEGTLRKHLEHLYRKLDVTTRAGATARAIELGVHR
jgi:DNA-binding CsgD family transcriptional regulator